MNFLFEIRIYSIIDILVNFYIKPIKKSFHLKKISLENVKNLVFQKKNFIQHDTEFIVRCNLLNMLRIGRFFFPTVFLISI